MGSKTSFRRTPAVPLKDLPGSLPNVSIPDNVDHAGIAEMCLDDLKERLKSGHLQSDAVWRDIHALTGTFRTFYGADCVAAAWMTLSKKLASGRFKLMPNSSSVIRSSQKLGWVQVNFCFTTSGTLPGKCSGSLRVVPSSDDLVPWRIWVVTTVLEEIEGQGNPDILMSISGSIGASLNGHATTNGSTTTDDFSMVEDSRGINGSDVSNDHTKINSSTTINGHRIEPEYFQAAVIGAGMAGLSIAGRLKALGVTCVTIESNSEVGGNWRNRYKSVRLHTNKESSQLPFGRVFGPERPYFLSGDDLAEGYQKFVHEYEINVRISTRVEKATWSEDSKTWTLHLNSPSNAQTITATHLILAVGAGGQTPNMPQYPNRKLFKGTITHSASYRSPSPWRGKSVLIIGTANTAHDVAEDMLSANAASVTLVQRNPTPVLPIAYYKRVFDPLYNADTPIELSDRMSLTAPLSISRAQAIAGWCSMAVEDRGYYDALERAGFRVEQPCDLGSIINERFGGHYLDVGASSRVIGGEVSPPFPDLYLHRETGCD